jgi:hypothetical protein
MAPLSPVILIVEDELLLRMDSFGTDAAVREHLTKRLGGLTAFSRSAAQGATSDGGKTVHDEIIVFEVMTDPARKPVPGIG